MTAMKSQATLNMQTIFIALLMFYAPLDYGATGSLAKLTIVAFVSFIVSYSAIVGYFKVGAFMQSASNSMVDIIISLILLFSFVWLFLPMPISWVNALSPFVFEAYEQSSQLLKTDLSSFQSILFDTKNSRLEVAVYISAILLYLMMVLFLNKRNAMVLCFVALAMLSGQILFTYYDKAMGFDFITPALVDGHQYRFHGTFINSNHTSAFFNLLMFMGLVGLYATRFRSAKWLGFIALLLIGFVSYYQIQIGSRSGILSPFFSFFILLIFMKLSIEFHLSKFFIIGLAVFISLLLFIQLFPSREIDLAQILNTETLYERSQQWMATFHMSNGSHFLGVGLGNYEQAFVSYKNQELSPFRYFHAHNTWLQFMAEAGLLGALFLFGLIGHVYSRLTKCLKIAELSRKDKVLTLLLSAGLLNILLQGVLESLFVSKAILILFFVYMAIAVIISQYLQNKYGVK